jgi:hypothetical protein
MDTMDALTQRIAELEAQVKSIRVIAYQDFIPQRQRKRLLGVLTDYENLHELVSRANLWIEQHQIEIISVETVLMSSLPDQEAESPKTRMNSPDNTMSLYQIVRVWYRQRAEVARPYTGETTRLDAD